MVLLKTEAQIDVPAFPAAVYAVITYPAHFHRWQAWHVGWPQGVPGMTAGRPFVQTVRLTGRTAEVRWNVVELRAPLAVALEGTGPAGMMLHCTYQLCAAGTGTRVQLHVELRSGPLARGLALRRRAHRQEHALLQESLGNLQALVIDAVRPPKPTRPVRRVAPLAPLAPVMAVIAVTQAVAITTPVRVATRLASTLTTVARRAEPKRLPRLLRRFRRR